MTLGLPRADHVQGVPFCSDTYVGMYILCRCKAKLSPSAVPVSNSTCMYTSAFCVSRYLAQQEGQDGDMATSGRCTTTVNGSRERRCEEVETGMRLRRGGQHAPWALAWRGPWW